MPLNPVYLPKVDGLQTELSSINSDPRSLADCTDVISNREDFLESRHGHPSAPIVTSVIGSAVDLYAFRNDTNKVFVPIYKVSNVYQFKTISQPGDEITDSGPSPSVESLLRDITSISTTRTSQVNVKPTAFAHDERLLFLTDYGVYFRGYTSPGAANAKKVEFPVIRQATIEPYWNPTVNPVTDIQEENRHWLVSGYQVNIKIVFEIEAKDGNKGERRLASPTSRVYEAKNFNLSNTATGSRTSNMLIRITDMVISNIPEGHAVYMKIYRTPQFQIGTAAITQYFLAAPEVQLSSATVLAPLSYLYLTTNDDGITALEPLYNDSTQGGSAVTNHAPIPAKNVTQFRNYYIYSNLALPTITSFGIKAMPNSDDTLSIKLSGVTGILDLTHTITFKSSGASGASEINIPANKAAASFTNPYIGDEADLTFQGLRTSQALDVTIKIVPGTGKGQVEPYGEMTKVQFQNPGGQNSVVRVYPAIAGFDINRFGQPGIAVIVDPDGVIKGIFSYSNYKRVASSAGFIDFEGAVFVGTAPSTEIATKHYLYFIPGESTANITLYYGNGASYLSLLPCKNSLEYPIAKPASVSVSGSLKYYADSTFAVNPQYVGLLTKPQGKLFDELAQRISDNIQKNINTNSTIVSCTGGDVLDPGVVNVEILDYRYEKIEFKRKDPSVDAYEPPISATEYTEFAVSEKSISSFVISKENNPELIPYSGIKTPNVAGPYLPPKVGDPNKAIVACAATKDSVYLLKEDGIARVFIGFGALVPTIDGINIFDNTTFCVSSGSVQVLNDSVLFLAQNGVHAISGNNIDKVSRQIETELKKAISQSRAASKLNDIRSFSNSAKGLYGLHIPTGVTSYVTYVLNVQTMRWTKWSNTFNGAVTDLDGRLTTLTSDNSGNYIRQDRYTNGDPRAEVDQIDDEFVLTGSSSDAGLVRTISSQPGLGIRVLRFGSKQVYYKKGATLYPVSVQNSGVDSAIITFQSTQPDYSPSTDSLIVGVNMMLEFQPFTNSNPSTLKMFSEYHAHTEESVLDLSVSFRTEARSTFSVVKTFSTSPNNRTIYRCYIPLEATRGRFLYRKLTHTRPYQICAIPAQTIVFRETGSERVNKQQ